MEDSDDDKIDDMARPIASLEPEARRMVLIILLVITIPALIVYFVFEFLHDKWSAFITIGTIAGIAVVALILHRLQTIQFSLKTVLIAILTLQIPMGLLLTSKTPAQTNLGIVALLLWITGVVTYVLVGTKGAAKE